MEHVESSIIPTRQPLALSRQALSWIGAGIIAMPLAVLLHEIGHRLAHLIFGFQGSALHYSSTTYDLEKQFWQQVFRGDMQAAAALIPPWQVATATLAGLLVTYAVVIVCCVVAVKYRPHPMVVAVGIASPLRFISGIPTLAAWFSGKPVRPGTDEANLAVLTGIPVVLLVLAGLILLVCAWLWLVRSIPKHQRVVALGGLLAGLVAGFLLYFRLVGPLLLP